MTLPASGSLSMSQIQSEFNVGNNLNAYRNGRWYLDTNARGFFSGGSISFSDFFSKRKDSPVVAGSTTLTSSQNFTVPMFNNFYVTVVGGQGGQGGQSGNCAGGGYGSSGGGTSLAGYVSVGGGSGGAPSLNNGTQPSSSTSVSISDANQSTVLALYNQVKAATVGGGGGGGSRGANLNTYTVCYQYGYVNGFYTCVAAYAYSACDGYLSYGATGANGYISISWN